MGVVKGAQGELVISTEVWQSADNPTEGELFLEITLCRKRYGMRVVRGEIKCGEKGRAGWAWRVLKPLITES